MAKKKQTEDPGAGLRALKQDLKAGTPARLYIFHGEEAFLRSSWLEQLRGKLVSGPMETVNHHRFEGRNLSLDALEDAVSSLPMMAEQTLVEVDDYDMFKAAEADRSRLAALLADLPDYCCLVFIFSTVAWKPDGRQKKLMEPIRKYGRIVEFGKQSEASLSNWIVRHFRALDKSIDSGLCRRMIFLTGGDMSTLLTEIEKVAACAPGQQITQADIDAVVEPVLDARVFDITDALADRNFNLALQKLQEIFRMQAEPIQVCAVIGGQLRRLRCARVLTGAGRGMAELQRLCGIGDYQARLTMQAARKFSDSWCSMAVVAACETDYALKSSLDDGERLLELLLMRLALEAGT